MNGITHVNKFFVTIVNGLRLVIMNDLSVFSYRGDIMNVTKIDIAEMRMSSANGRNAIRNKNGLWRNDEVPYVISNQYNSYERGIIAKAFAEYHRETCIK